MTDLGNGMVRITDDNGNSIIIEKEQAALIKDGINLMENSNQELLCE